jgi:hypothetical protein
VIEQYRDELEIQIRGTTDDQRIADEQRIADDREAVASDLLNILHKSVPIYFFLEKKNLSPHSSIPIQSIATNGPSLVSGIEASSNPRLIKSCC